MVDKHCDICGYPHVKTRNGVTSITIATESRDPNTVHERTPVKFETSLYKDTAVCHLCWREQLKFGAVSQKRIKREARTRKGALC